MIFCHEIMGIPVEDDNDMEQGRTHCMLLLAVVSEGLSQGDSETLKDIKVVASVAVTKVHIPDTVPNKGMLWGIGVVLSLSRYKLSETHRSVLGDLKYGMGSVPQWKTSGPFIRSYTTGLC